MSDVLILAVPAALLLTIITGPLGAFMLWGRMIYFGETVAHAALFGVGLGFLLQIDPMIGVAGIAVVIALLLARSGRDRALAADTVLGVLAHGALAAGLVMAALTAGPGHFEVEEYLFGDLMSVTFRDVLIIGAVTLSGGLVLATFWQQMIATVVHAELAEVEGIAIGRMRALLTLMIALTIAIAMKLVGLLLVVSLMIIPAASARPWARTPEHMVLIATLAGMGSVVLGIAAARFWDIPVGPAIVLAATLVFCVSRLTKRRNSV